jgi:exopolyphosphatase/pppGpp-phosphohydrolase
MDERHPEIDDYIARRAELAKKKAKAKKKAAAAVPVVETSTAAAPVVEASKTYDVHGVQMTPEEMAKQLAWHLENNSGQRRARQGRIDA